MTAIATADKFWEPQHRLAGLLRMAAGGRGPGGGRERGPGGGRERGPARGRGRPRAGKPFGGNFMFGGPPWGGPGGPFRHGPRARRGDVRDAALLLLAEAPRNGYQLMQEIEERSGGVWRPSPGSVYPALAQLEDEGLVRSEQHEGGRAYVLTDAGRACVDERSDELPAPWDEMSEAIDDGVAGLAGELKQVAMAARQLVHVGTDRQVAEAHSLLSEARRGLYRLLAEDGAGEAGEAGEEGGE